MIHKFDELLQDKQVAALVASQPLESVGGPGDVIFPPTYPLGDKNEPGYNIDGFRNDENVCLIDSVGSQSNRLEPIFKEDGYRHLIPQITIQHDDGVVHLLDASHRAADAFVRNTPELNVAIRDAFLDFKKTGNAEQLARIAPTSIVFGVWDSRGTGVKLPRIINATIFADNVQALTRSAQFTPTIHNFAVDEDDNSNKKIAKVRGERGWNYVPATGYPGGVTAEGIRRELRIHLPTLRTLGDAKLQRYLLGLTLVAATYPVPGYLRQGCNLIPADGPGIMWRVARYDGQKQDVHMLHEEALEYATKAAAEFGVREPATYEFNEKAAIKELKMAKEAWEKMVKEEGTVAK